MLEGGCSSCYMNWGACFDLLFGVLKLPKAEKRGTTLKA